MRIKRILVAIDFSATSTDALTAALVLSQRFAAEILLLHVVEPVYIAEPNVASADLTTFLDVQERNAVEQLERLRTSLGPQGRHAQVLVHCGVPAQVIVEVARRTAADLIVIGTHGRTGLSHMLIGSVAERVLRLAGCPVLTVPPAARQR
ncbi:MAG: universal stress protein [Candidatus Binatia bacterium]